MSFNYDPTPTSETETLDDIISKIEEWVDEIYKERDKNQDMTAYEQIEIDTYRNVLLLIRTKKSGLEKRLRMQKLYNKRWQPFF
jgi:hypothetical protein